MREKYIEQQLTRAVKSRGGLCEKWNSGTVGWPDRIVLLPDGKFGFVEVKAPGKEPRNKDFNFDTKQGSNSHIKRISTLFRH